MKKTNLKQLINLTDLMQITDCEIDDLKFIIKIHDELIKNGIVYFLTEEYILRLLDFYNKKHLYLPCIQYMNNNGFKFVENLAKK